MKSVCLPLFINRDVQYIEILIKLLLLLVAMSWQICSESRWILSGAWHQGATDTEENIGKEQGSQDNEAHWYDGDRTGCLQCAETDWGCTEAQWLQSALQMAKTEFWCCRGHGVRPCPDRFMKPHYKSLCLHYVLSVTQTVHIFIGTHFRVGVAAFHPFFID